MQFLLRYINLTPDNHNNHIDHLRSVRALSQASLVLLLQCLHHSLLHEYISLHSYYR
jgi:hypothetical protein